MQKSAIVIGSGIVAISTAYALLNRNWKVTMLERNHKTLGASIRNFGMIWPIGQANDYNLELANSSASIWSDLATKAKFHIQEKGSLHLAYTKEEQDVLQEFIDAENGIRPIQWIDKEIIDNFSMAVNKKELKGGMYSLSEKIVDPREAVEKLILMLSEDTNFRIYYNAQVLNIQDNICLGSFDSWVADQIFVCTGGDMNILYPEKFNEKGIPCELNMMRVTAMVGYNISLPLCAGLTLIHYRAFKNLKSIFHLQETFRERLPEYLKYGIHVMASQFESGEITIGDSHIYGDVGSPFIDQHINQLILDYLHTFCKIPDLRISSYWKGIYLKSKSEEQFCFEKIDSNCYWINCFGGAGMTLAFGAIESRLSTLLD